jgi:hypothetical protein
LVVVNTSHRKKADAAEYPWIFRRVGLLYIEPSGKTGVLCV